MLQAWLDHRRNTWTDEHGRRPVTQLDPLLPEAQVDPDERSRRRLAGRSVGRDRPDRHRSSGSAARRGRSSGSGLHGDGARHGNGPDRRCRGLVVPRQDQPRRCDPGALQSFTVDEDDDLRIACRPFVRGRIHHRRRVCGEWYVDRNGGLEITPGFYQLRADDHMGNVLGRLRTPPAQTYTSVTFPEGFTIDRMGRRVDTVVERMDEADFITAATTAPRDGRGGCRPDAPRWKGCSSPTPTPSPTPTVRRAADRADDRPDGTRRRPGGHRGQGRRRSAITPYEVLIVASMIEREAAVPEDRAKISRVILNRLFVSGSIRTTRFPLQIDAAVLYGRDQVGLDPDTAVLRAASDRHAVEHLHPGRSARPHRSPTRAVRRFALR